MIGVCLSQDLPRGGWTSAASKVLSQEITDLIKSYPSPSPFSTSSLTLYVTFFFCSPLYRFPLYLSVHLLLSPFFTPLYITYIFLLALFSLTFLFSLSPHPPHRTSPLSSPPLPLGHKELIQPPVPESYLNFSCVSRPAAELWQSLRDPVTLGVHEEEMQDIL